MQDTEDITDKSEDVRELERAYAVSMYAEETEVGRICRGLKVSDSGSRILLTDKFFFL